ncbi:hypothetical protein IMX26_10380 [Clostridium sp. 'deep sea']|uniref:hypothetical protein n=1 Tax=Clostridium sp. 'deep sea' TaxID=2779445 RepID=UPI00189651CA|nr:hypothetical protein [Clostridium sp. 'deep sea']QOR33898.1 hypothetical protein IMX26_10380 [Clostridium sp. 'deep sea']
MYKELKMKDLIIFFMPMAAMSMIMKASHNIINYALGQTPNTAIALSAYSVAMSVSMMIMAPIWVLSKVTTAVAQGRKSAKNSINVALQATMLVSAIMILIAYTPLNKLVFKTLMGVSTETFPDVLKAFKVFIFMPILGAIRATHQSFIALRRKTIWLTIGTIIRIISMFILTKILITLNLIRGSYIGALILVIGFGIEGLVWFIKGRPWLKEANAANTANVDENSTSKIWLLLLPLVIAQLINGFVDTSISAGLNRVTNPELSLSSYFLARTIAWIFLAVSYSASQMVLVFVKKQTDFKFVKKFVYILSVIMVILVGLVAFTPLGKFMYVNILNVEVGLAKLALKSLAVFAFAPPAMFIVEMYQGVLIKKRQSKKITICKVVNITVLIATIFTLVKLAPQLGGMIGSFSFTLAYYCEALVTYLLSCKHVTSFNEEQQLLNQVV